MEDRLSLDNIYLVSRMKCAQRKRFLQSNHSQSKNENISEYGNANFNSSELFCIPCRIPSENTSVGKLRMQQTCLARYYWTEER